MVEEFTRGRTIIRYIRHLFAFHYGILARVNTENVLDSLVIDFDIDDAVHCYTLRDFLFGETVFWLATWENEPQQILDSMRPPEEIVKTALELMFDRAKGGTEMQIYSLIDNNCEHFVRRCTFRHPDAQISRQIDRIAADSRHAWFRMGFLALTNTLASEKIRKLGGPRNTNPPHAIRLNLSDFQ